VSAGALWDQVASWFENQADQTIETSCARVFLAGDVAWKIKRPMQLPFLDFSSLAGRKWALDRELAFNQRWAANIYRRVCAVTCDGVSFELDGQGEVVEWLLEMRRFDPSAVLGNQPHTVDGELAEALGRLIARAHIEAPVTPAGGGVAALGYTITVNETSLRCAAPILGPDAIESLIDRTRAGLKTMTPRLESRRLSGLGRQCHGDLHLGNILLEDGRPIPFDCIEFNDRLSNIDVLYDTAFSAMDLAVLGRAGAANRLLNAYMDEASRGLPAAHWEGLSALPLFQSVRAAVRAHVSEATGQNDLARQYIAAAGEFLQASPPRLFAVGGLSGTGKTTLARAVAPLVPGAPGAVILRSDEIRKRLWGVGHVEPLPDAAYEADWDARIYDQMFSLAATVIRAGRSVVLDATFLAPQVRQRAEKSADRLSVRFAPVWLEGEASELRARLAARTKDASDATPEVLERQLARDAGQLAWRRVSAQGDFAVAAREIIGMARS
jgi:aminoglycoside phosphotransferase family enzyme/predicted kinase